MPLMSSPPLLPVSAPATTATATTNIQSTTAISLLRSFLTRLTAYVRHALCNSRPWTELIDWTAFSRPESLSDGVSRVRKNFSYFRTNYMILLALLLVGSLLTHPFSLLLLLSLMAAWLFLYAFRPSDQPLTLGGRTFSDHEILAILCTLTLVVIFLTSVGSLLMSTIMIGLAIVAAHGAFRIPEDLFLGEQEAFGSGLFSLVGGAASSAAAAAPVIVSHV